MGQRAASRPAARSAPAPAMAMGKLVPTAAGKRMLVLGGGGFAGREICRNAVAQGYRVTSLTRRGVNPLPEDALLKQVNWKLGDALDARLVTALVNDADAICHAIGILAGRK